MTSGGQPPRRAPPITSNPRSGNAPNPMASTPTKGFAWAFPEHPEKEDMDDDASIDSSRQPSLASSNTVGSSQFDGPLQHKTITSLQGLDAAGSGNYSRTPELRVSHKLAERKRRSEMKDLFDALNSKLPTSASNKSSKWEVLNKCKSSRSIPDRLVDPLTLRAAVEYIDNLKHAFDQLRKDNSNLRNELEVARSAQDENQHLTNEIHAMYQQLCRVDPGGHHVFGPVSGHFAKSDTHTSSRAAPGYTPMQGVEYGHQYDRR